MLTLLRFRVYTSETTHHDLTVIPADRMRAERASTTELPPSQRGEGASKVHRESYLMLWLWCAARRAQVTTDSFQTWAETVLDYDRLTPEGEPVADDTPAEDVEDEPVGPTQTAALTT
jgi:hypothetical protein